MQAHFRVLIYERASHTCIHASKPMGQVHIAQYKMHIGRAPHAKFLFSHIRCRSNTRTSTRMRVYLRTTVRTHTTYMHLHARTTCAYINMHELTCVHTHTHAHKHTYVHTHTHRFSTRYTGGNTDGVCHGSDGRETILTGRDANPRVQATCYHANATWSSKHNLHSGGRVPSAKGDADAHDASHRRDAASVPERRVHWYAPVPPCYPAQLFSSCHFAHSTQCVHVAVGAAPVEHGCC